jgi:hypothetical protein
MPRGGNGNGRRARPRALGGQRDDAPDPAGPDDIHESVRVLTGNEEFTGKEEQCPGYAGNGLKALSFRQADLRHR